MEVCLFFKGVFPSVVAHSSTASINGEIYVFGGYNGIANDKLFRLNISSSWCSMFSTQSTCVNITGCSWCNSKSFNRSFCYNSDVSLPLTFSIKTVSGNRCSVSPVALPLTDEIISTTDPCAQYNASEACSTCIQAKGLYLLLVLLYCRQFLSLVRKNWK